MGGTSSRSLIRLKSRFEVGLQSSEGLKGTGRSASKLTHIAVGRRPQLSIMVPHGKVVASSETESRQKASVPLMTESLKSYTITFILF